MNQAYVPFSDVLYRRPLIFSVVPLRDTKTGEKVHDERVLKNLNSRIDEMSALLKDHARLNAVSVPELVEENHEGKPRYNSVYTRALSRGIADRIHKDAIVNKVVVHLEDYSDLVGWIKETQSLGINNVIFVGGNTRHHRYPGPSVPEANVAATHAVRNLHVDSLTIGNICLPERRKEARTMLYKTMTGAKFFTTQMLFDSKRVLEVLYEYSRLCKYADIKPATVLLSFAPLRSVADLNFLDFLGVELPEEAKHYILDSGEQSDAPERSIINSLRIYTDVVSTLSQDNVDVPIGVNVEQLTKTNLVHSLKMLEKFEHFIDLDAVSFRKLERLGD